MKTIGLTLAIVLVFATACWGAEAFEQLTVSTAAVTPTAATLNANNVAKMTCSVGGTADEYVRIRTDGTNASATIGLKLKVDTIFTLDDRKSISNFTAIRDTANSSNIILDCEYYSR